MENSEEEDRQRQAERYVSGFKYRFEEKFGVVPKVSYRLEPPREVQNLISLELIEQAANTVLNTLSEQFYSEGIRTVFHDTNVLLCRWCYYKLSIDAGHTKSRMSKYIKQSQASVGYGLGKINKLILEKNEREQAIYSKIKNLLDEKIFRGLEIL